MSLNIALIIYCIGLITYVSGKIVTSITSITYKQSMDIFDQVIIESYNFAKNVCGYELFSVESDKQEKFLIEAVTFAKKYYEVLLKEINMYDEDKLCKVLISKIVVNTFEDKKNDI